MQRMWIILRRRLAGYRGSKPPAIIYGESSLDDTEQGYPLCQDQAAQKQLPRKRLPRDGRFLHGTSYLGQTELKSRRTPTSMSPGFDSSTHSSPAWLTPLSRIIHGEPLWRSPIPGGLVPSYYDDLLESLNRQVGIERVDVSTPSSTASIETPFMRTTTLKDASKSTAKPRSQSRFHYIGKRRVDLDYAIGDNVQIDESDIWGKVVGISIASCGLRYQVEWLHRGSNQSSWFDALRLNEM